MSVSDAFLFALIASACFGLALVVTQFGLRHAVAADGALVSISATAMLFWAFAPIALDLGEWNTLAAGIFAFVGLFFPAAVTLLTFEANQRMGPTVAGALGSTAPLFATAAATLFLGERLTPLTVAAILGVVGGVVLLSWHRKNGPDKWASRFLVLPLTAAFLRGVAQPVTKLGLALWSSAFAAGLIGYSVSVIALIVAARFPRRALPFTINVKGALWFALVGVSNGLGVLCTYVALNRGAITIVAPTVATYPLFSLLFATLLLPQHRVTETSVLGIALIVAGIAGLLIDR